MRKIIPLFFLVFIFSSLFFNPTIYSESLTFTKDNNVSIQRINIEVEQNALKKVANNPTVYITKSGKKYHRSGCRYLRKSKIAIKLKEAKRRGYTPCKVCKPPT